MTNAALAALAAEALAVPNNKDDFRIGVMQEMPPYQARQVNLPLYAH